MPHRSPGLVFSDPSCHPCIWCTACATTWKGISILSCFVSLFVQRNRSSKQTTSIGSGSGSKSSKSGRSVGISASRPSSKKTPPTTPTNSSSGLIGSTSSVGSRETLYRTHSEPSPMINISTNNDNQKDDPGHHGEEKHNITGGGGHIEPNDSNDNSFNSNNNNNSSGNTYPITNSSSHSSGSTNNTKDTNENDADYIDSEGDTPESGSGRKPKSSRTQALRQSDARAGKSIHHFHFW